MEEIAIWGLVACSAVHLFGRIRQRLGIINGTLWAVEYIAGVYGFAVFSALLIASKVF